jgi:hypothetical protein
MTKRFALLALLLFASPAFADSQDCYGFDDSFAIKETALAKVIILNARFLKTPDCAEDACRLKAYVVKGDPLIITQTTANAVCATYLSPKGTVFAGWLPLSAIAKEPDPTVTLKDWQGHWKRVEANITIAVEKDMLRIEGDATWGSGDPERVARGGVNIGDIGGTVKPVNNTLAFTAGDDKTLPYEAGDQYSCRAKMRLLPPYLLVSDNMMCGGNNVSFNGVYSRKAH